jgi:hypothetical protein
METSQDFFYWISDRSNFSLNNYLEKARLFDAFVNDYVDYKKWLSRNKFSNWVSKYANYMGYKFHETHSGSIRYFMVSDTDEVKEPMEIDWEDNELKF